MGLLTKWFALGVGIFALLASPKGVASESIDVAVASNFMNPAREIVEAFEKKFEKKYYSINLSFGSSGKLFSQIKNGAPYQVFLSADQDKPKKLEESGLSVRGFRFTYAFGTLILWSAKEGFVDSEGEILRVGDFRKIAIANSQLAPYGRAALEVIRRLNIEDKLQPKLVQGENISQAFQFVSSKNAELG
ncbi:MAG: molybdate ABC transporter substrate-binding protein, partial [Bdellovibrionales bacterium]|nr:molybdate ABC transporter substrate-binding protein [Bdellovibrionales bacterium]